MDHRGTRAGSCFDLSAMFAAAASLALMAAPHATLAQDIRSPFGDGSDMGFPARAPSKRPAQDAPRRDAPAPAAVGTGRLDVAPASVGPIENTDLPPLPGHSVSITDGAGAPTGDATAEAGRVEQSLAGLELPPRSPALAEAFRKLVLATPPAAGRPADRGVRFEALYRAGLLADAARLIADPGNDAILAALSARSELALGHVDSSCALARQANSTLATLPPPLVAEIIATQGYCAAAAGNLQQAGLAADLARENQGASPVTLAILDAVATGTRPELPQGRRLGVLDERLLRLINGATPGQDIEHADAALLAALAGDEALDPARRVAAAEAAAAANIVPAETLAAAWRTAPQPDIGPGEHGSSIERALRRAVLFRAIENERTPARKTRYIRSLIDDARRAGLYHQTLALLAPAVLDLEPVPEIGWFAETAVETLASAQRYDRARQWARFAGSLDAPRADLSHWLALIDVAEHAAAQRGDSLGSIEDMALHGRFSSDVLHRLATVLDALDYNVPVRLWEAASRTPQPNGGYLPASGVLAELQGAARDRNALATVTLAIKTIGPGTADQANLLALGDTIRALRHVGLEAEARRLAFESLLVQWPRTASN